MTAWADAFRDASVRAGLAAEDKDRALLARCPDEDSGGAQCTADRESAHEHRYDQADLPGYDPTLY